MINTPPDTRIAEMRKRALAVGADGTPDWLESHITSCYRKIDDYRPPTTAVAVVWLEQRRQQLIQSVLIEGERFAQETLRASKLAETIAAHEVTGVRLITENVDLRTQLEQAERELAELKKIADQAMDGLTDLEKRLESAERERDYLAERVEAYEAVQSQSNQGKANDVPLR